ncbi:MAG: hypothetical protein WC824_12985, partial [Bacteroidota bacterium]
MALFKVSIEVISEVTDHPNADRLDLAHVAGCGFQFCVGKDSYHVGDWVVYIPIDSVLPDVIADGLGVKSFLAGAQKNRVKTAVLRGQISQGLVCKPEAVLPEGTEMPEVGVDISALLGISKYEPPETFSAGARLLPLPEGLGYYDIEGAERFQNVVALLMDMPVYVTEKVEGSNMTVMARTAEEDTPVVCQHGHRIAPDSPSQQNTYVDTARERGLLEVAHNLPGG